MAELLLVLHSSLNSAADGTGQALGEDCFERNLCPHKIPKDFCEFHIVVVRSISTLGKPMEIVYAIDSFVHSCPEVGFPFRSSDYPPCLPRSTCK